ncbi:hypothetical protein CFOL_v3_34064 [Cephalotus follicularis]|uniref:Putative plant transposon protein domain-containing protein n=1 Tax=Cephalotus follicularis TaxID=3775 RepID=A0A1Q3DDW0_CEPFO|nr:hypothetical protein CFOL_v3_34064 [Cephalotus follicularis]
MVRTKRGGKKKGASSSQPPKSAKKQRLDIREPSPDPALQSDSESEEHSPIPLRSVTFVDKRVMGGRNIDLNFCSSEFSFVSWLEDLNLIPLVQISEPFYIKLVKEFYSNLRMASNYNEEFALTSTVKGERIYLNARILASILHIPHTGIYVFEHKKWPEVEGFHPNHILSILYPNDPNVHPNMALTTNHLSVDHRLLHHLIVHQILPTGGGYAKLSRMQVFLMWCILSKIEFCFPLLMLKTMIRAFSQKKFVLPFGSILTKIFLHFHIRLEGEVATELKKEDTYNKSTLNRMGWKKQQGIWTYCPRADQAPRIAREEQEDNPSWEQTAPAQAQTAPGQAQTAPGQAQGSSSSTDFDRMMELMQSQLASMQGSFDGQLKQIKMQLGSLAEDHKILHKEYENVDEGVYYDLRVVKRCLKRIERMLANAKVIDLCEDTTGDEGDSSSDSDTPTAPAES